MLKTRVLVLIILCAAFPGTARAQGGFWDWMEGLSGPGPSHGYTMVLRAFCVKEKQNFAGCLNDSDQSIRGVFRVHSTVPYLTTGDNPRFSDTPSDTRTIHVWRYGATYFARITPMLDVGAGIGGLMFTAADFSSNVNKFTFTPVDVAIVPFARSNSAWSRVLRIEFTETLIGWKINANEFGTNTSNYSKGTEFARSLMVGFDFGSFLP